MIIVEENNQGCQVSRWPARPTRSSWGGRSGGRRGSACGRIKGRELALALPTGTVLADGDILYVGAGLHVTVEAEEEDVLVVPLGDAAAAAALAYELGNRHLPVSIRDNVS